MSGYKEKAIGRTAVMGAGHCLRRAFVAVVALLCVQSAIAQIGEHRSELSVGVNGGYMLSNVGFNPDVPQGLLGGITGGITVRYTC